MLDDAPISQLRVPPQSVEAEQAVLGGLMLAPTAYDIVADVLEADDFYRRDHQLIYTAIGELASKNRPYDAVTLGEWFEAHGQAELVAGGAYLVELASTTPSAANIMAYARIVRDKALLRQMIEAGTEIVSRGFHPDGEETSDILAEAEGRMMKVGSRVIKEVEDGEAGLKRTVAELARRRQAGPHALLGVTTGLDELDELTMGLQATDLVILAGRPSMGKTAKMRNMARAAARSGKRVATFSLEMGAEQIYMRDIAAMSKVELRKVMRPALATPQEMEAIRAAISKLRSYEWWLDDSPSLTHHQIVARLRRLKRQHKVDLAFIDYLQFIDLSRELRNHNLTTAVQQATRAFKAAAKELKIPVVLLSQLNRSVESRGDKRPQMSDLRESGAIEQDADVVMFVHRPAYYERDLDRDDPKHHLAEVIVAKQRNGPTGIVSSYWDGATQRFDNYTYQTAPATVYERRGTGFEPRPSTGLCSGT